jgi:hypothetical protein
MRHELRWVQDYLNTNSSTVDMNVTYNSLSGTFHVGLSPAGIAYNLNRF